MDGSKAGIATALAEIGTGDVPEAGRQLAMFGDTAAEPVAEGERRSAGRPVGSRNRRTAEMVRYLFEVKRHKSPLEWLTELFNRPVSEICREFGLEDKADAVKLQRDAAIACLPYVHQKQPLAVQAVGKTAGMLVLPGEDGTAEEQADELGFDLVLAADGKMQGYQRLDAEDIEQSETQQSEGGPK